MPNKTSRRNFLKSSVGLVALLATCLNDLEALAAGLSAKKGIVIMLDPSHGPGNLKKGKYDSGSVYAGIEEAELVLDYAKQIKEILETKEIEVKLTRIYGKEAKTDIAEMPRKERAKFANDLNINIYIRLEASESGYKFKNKWYDVKRGPRTYYQYNHPKNAESKKLAEHIQASLINTLSSIKGLELDATAVKEIDDEVLKSLKMPGCVVEMGSINTKDLAYLTEGRNLMSAAFARGIFSYLTKD